MSNSQPQPSWDQYHQSTPKLLPPTVFEKTTSGGGMDSTNSLDVTLNAANVNSTDAARAATTATDFLPFPLSNENQMLLQLSGEIEKYRFELKKLKSENELLRHRNKDFVEQAQLYSEASERRKISITALEEVIHKQTREIQALKCELLGERESSSARLAATEKRLNERITELTESTNGAEARRKQSAAEAERLTTELEKFRAEHERETSELHARLEQIRAEKATTIEENEAKTRTTLEENRRLVSELAQLRAYVNDSMPTVQTVREMSEERQRCEAELVRLKVRNEQLAGDNNALQIRLKSINEILSIQENQLEAKQPVGKLTPVERRYHGLLNKWRTKVFEMLVQLKSQEINAKLERSEVERARAELSERLEAETSRVRILENVIQDKKAELSVLVSDRTVLNERVSELKEKNEALEKQRAVDWQSSLELKSQIDKLVREYVLIEESFRVINKKLSQFDQRLEFSKNRLGVVKALFAASKKDKKSSSSSPPLPPPHPPQPPSLNFTSILSSIHGSANLNEAQISSLDVFGEKNQQEEDKLLLKNELEKVLNERDLLSTRLQHDSDEMQSRLTKIKTDHDLVVATLEARLREARETSEQREAEIEQTRLQLASKTQLYQELQVKYEALERELGQMRAQWETDMEKRLREREVDFVSKLSSMDERLNEARREQAKAAVMVRQIERSSTREKERLETLLKSCDAYYKQHLVRLQDRMRGLERERNAFALSLRQNGINSSTSLLATETAAKSSNVSGLKSPLGFFERDSDVKSWLEKSGSLSERLAVKNNSSREKVVVNKTALPEMTSFWMDSNASAGEQEAAAAAAAPAYVETNDEEVDEANSLKTANSGAGNNVEILQQIRKIMGDLELSDDDVEDAEKEDATKTQYDILWGKENDFEQESVEGSNRERTDQSLFEVEHVIDEFFTQKPAGK